MGRLQAATSPNVIHNAMLALYRMLALSPKRTPPVDNRDLASK
jgi:hypothetical protein